MNRAVLAPTAEEVRRDPRFRAAVAAGPGGVEWRLRAACLEHDPELFFPTAAEVPRAALAVCRSCPVRGECLAAALTDAEGDGVWGGTTPEERRVMRRVWVDRAGAGTEPAPR